MYLHGQWTLWGNGLAQVTPSVIAYAMAQASFFSSIYSIYWYNARRSLLYPHARSAVWKTVSSISRNFITRLWSFSRRKMTGRQKHSPGGTSEFLVSPERVWQYFFAQEFFPDNLARRATMARKAMLLWIPTPADRRWDKCDWNVLWNDVKSRTNEDAAAACVPSHSDSNHPLAHCARKRSMFLDAPAHCFGLCHGHLVLSCLVLSCLCSTLYSVLLSGMFIFLGCSCLLTTL